MRHSLLAVTCTLALTAAVGHVHAATYTFQTIDSPGVGGIPPDRFTAPFSGINDKGQILGQDSTGSFVDTNGNFTYFNLPGSTSPVFYTRSNVTFFGALNNNGQIVGLTGNGNLGSSSGGVGFLDTNGSFVKIVPPDAAQSNPNLTFVPLSINDYGQIVGSYVDVVNINMKYASPSTGGPILNSDGSAVPFNLPIAGASVLDLTGINNIGQIIGIYSIGSNSNIDNQAFLYSSGIVDNINPPNAIPNDTNIAGISNTGEIVGSYQTFPNTTFPTGNANGFVYDKGVYTTIDVPGALDTFAQGVNSTGNIVGNYIDGTGYHGFLATPVSVPEPTSLALLSAALTALGLAVRRRPAA